MKQTDDVERPAPDFLRRLGSYPRWEVGAGSGVPVDRLLAYETGVAARSAKDFATVRRSLANQPARDENPTSTTTRRAIKNPTSATTRRAIRWKSHEMAICENCPSQATRGGNRP